MTRTIIALLIGFILMAPASRAQFGVVVPETVVEWSASARPPSTAPRMTSSFTAGDRVYLTLSAEIAEGWRVYAINSPAGRPLELEWDALPDGIASYGPLSESQALRGHDSGLDADYTYYESSARIWQGFQVGRNADVGEHRVTGRLRYAACNDELCLPVKTFPYSVRFEVTGRSSL